MAWVFEVVLQGNAKHDNTGLKFNLVAADYTTASADAGTISTALGLLTDGVFASQKLVEVISTSGARAASGINAFDEAVVTTFLDATGDKKHTIRIPAPKPVMFTPDAETVDQTLAALIAYVGDLSTKVKLSDGESINTTVTNGIGGGYRRSKARRYKATS